MDSLVWSYSSLSCFEECPRKWHDKYILKNKESPSKEIEYGNFIHKSIENYLLDKGQLPSELDKNSALINSIKEQFKDQSAAELKMGLTEKLKPCEFFGKGVWGRSAADVALVHYNSANAFLGDWKTGKPREKEDQIKVQAMFLFKLFPKLQSIRGMNLWLKTNKRGDMYTFHREDEPKMWADLLPRINKMYNAVGTSNAQGMTPGPLCSYCPVKACQFNKA